MKETVTIRVRSTGADNFARVLTKNVTASCTSSPEQAARSAAKKYFKKRAFELRSLVIGGEDIYFAEAKR